MQNVVLINSAILVITFTANLGLAMYIFLHDKYSAANRAFSILLFFISLWIFAFWAFLNSSGYEWLLFWRRLTPASAALIAAALLHFALVFPKKERALALGTTVLAFFPGLAIVVLSLFSPWMVSGLTVGEEGVALLSKPVFGPAYFLFTTYFLVYFLAGISILVYKYFRAAGMERLQLFYVLFGVVISGLGGIVASLILPILGFSRLFTVGPAFTIVLAAFVGYAIIRHRLLNIEDFLSQGLVVITVVTVLVGTIMIVGRGIPGALLPFYTIIAETMLALLVYLKGPQNPANKAFSQMVFAMVLWTFSVFFSNYVLNFGAALFWNKMAYVSGVLIATLAVFFAWYFPEGKENFRLFQKYLFSLLAAVIIAVIFLSDLVVKNIFFVPEGTRVILGDFYFLLVLYLLAYIGYSFWEVWVKYHKAHGLHKVQIRYFLLGCFIATVLALLTNILYPQWGLASLGPSFMLIMVGFTTYAIVKHRLMGIEFVVRRGLIYSLLVLFTMLVYGVMLFLVGQLVPRESGQGFLLIIAFSSVVLTVSFQPILNWLEGITDRLFFKGHYDYQRTLQEVSQAITSVIKLEEIVRLVVRTLMGTMKVKEISFLILDRERGRFKSIWLELEGRGAHYKVIEIDERSPIVNWIKMKRDVLVGDEMEQSLVAENDETARKMLKEVYEEVEQLELAVWVPIISRGEVVGLIALGEKLSGDVFTSEDVRLLKTLGNQIAVGIENTALYEEVLAVKNYAEDILMSMSNGILTTGLAGDIITFNYMAEKLTGLNAKNVVGKNIGDVFGKDSVIVLAVESTLKDRSYSNFETELVLPGGAKSMVSISSTLLRDNHGKRMGALISLADISEVKELQGKVQRADKLAALGTMAAGMAHEIKNPLSSMKVLTQLLPLKFEDLEYRQKFSEIMPKEIERIDRIVESLLGFARAASPKFEKIRIEAVMADTLEYYKRKMEEGSIKLELHQEEVPIIIGDFGQLSQVFSNLVLNAIQVMQGGGVLRVVIRKGKRTAEGIDTVAVEVSDTGRGMNKETLSKLFDPFYTTKYGGTGLGLTISHSIVSGHRGFIDVRSEVGKGTTFTVILPVTQS